MNVITRWNPFKELEEMENRLSTVFGRSTWSRESHSLNQRLDGGALQSDACDSPCTIEQLVNPALDRLADAT